MKVLVIGLGQFGLFLARHLFKYGFEVFGWDINVAKKSQLDSLGLGHIWRRDFPVNVDIVVLAVFPNEINEELIQRLPEHALLVNMSSVQELAITALRRAKVGDNRFCSFHPLFGPVGIASSGWAGKQIVICHDCGDSRFASLLDTFASKGVTFDRMPPKEHDRKMKVHALAFLVSELVKVGIQDVDARYLTSSGRQLLGLLEFTEASQELRNLVLSNPALKELLPKLKQTLAKLEREFGWDK